MTRSFTSRLTISTRTGTRQILVTTKGNCMARPGRKRKEGPRTPNGELKNPTMKRLNEMNAERTADVIGVVLRQPHRRYFDNPEARMLHAPLGRFCKAIGASEATYDGVCEYAVLRQRYRLATAPGPRGVGHHTPTGGSPDGPAPETIEKWRIRIKDAHDQVHKHCGPDATQLCIMISNISVYQRELSPDEFTTWGPRLLSAMGEIAMSMGTLTNNPHPFK